MFETPILLITFNRPDHTHKVFEIIKKQKPKYLYVFQDGVRKGNETDKDKCKAVREIFGVTLDWDCELKTFFSDDNLGCGKGPSTGISWFFKNVEEGIILEDDCCPHEDFFPYCEKLLSLYKNNPKISFIGGSSFQDNHQRGDGSYYFSAGPHGTWGWATWRRAWQHFDYMVDSIDKRFIRKLINNYFMECRQKTYWMEIYELVKKNRCNDSCWDYQFYFSCWKYNMLAIIPNKNLITNIGYDEEGTHTIDTNNPAANGLTSSIFPIKIPSEIYLDKKADFYVHRNYIQPYEYGLSGLKRIPFRMNKMLKKFLKKEGSWF